MLAENQFLALKVPNNCTDWLQALDLSVNKAINDRLRHSFTTWYAAQVTLEIEARKSIQDVHVDTRLFIMTELQVKWIVSAYDYIRSNPSIIMNGFKVVGIVNAVEGQLYVSPADTRAALSDDEDPFAELTNKLALFEVIVYTNVLTCMINAVCVSKYVLS